MKFVIESVVELTLAQKKALESKAKKVDKTATFDYLLDKSLIGGLRISSNSKVLDLTLKAKLNQLRSELEV